MSDKQQIPATRSFHWLDVLVHGVSLYIYYRVSAVAAVFSPVSCVSHGMSLCWSHGTQPHVSVTYACLLCVTWYVIVLITWYTTTGISDIVGNPSYMYSSASVGPHVCTCLPPVCAKIQQYIDSPVLASTCNNILFSRFWCKTIVTCYIK